MVSVLPPEVLRVTEDGEVPGVGITEPSLVKTLGQNLYFRSGHLCVHGYIFVTNTCKTQRYVTKAPILVSLK